jgi:hypothetical protein
MSHTHLTEHELIALGVPGTPLPSDLESCTACLARQRSLAATLQEITTSAVDSADAAFPAERLARQRARILQRIGHYGQQARILTFPGRRATRPTLLQPHAVRRWIAGAAAAAFVVGVLAGHMVHDIPSLHVPLAASRAVYENVPLRASSEPIGDDELLRQVELAVESAGPLALRRIADVTPEAWDIQ